MARAPATQKNDKRRGGSRGETVAEREYRAYAALDPEQVTADADVLLDVPGLEVDGLQLKASELEAHVALKAQVLDLIKLNVGVDLQLDGVELDAKGVEAQALVKVRLDRLAAIVDRVMTTVDRNPDLVESLSQAIENIGEGGGDAEGESGDSADAEGESGEDALSGGQVAKVATKVVAKEIGSAVADEAKDIGLAATRKVKELGERRRERRAQKHNATPAAAKIADELGVDLEEVEGSGAEGRITVSDVRESS